MEKFLDSKDPKDCSIVVRALDRYFRKMSTCKHVVPGNFHSKNCIRKIIPGLDCYPLLLALINSVSRHEIEISCKKILEEMKAVCQEARQILMNEGNQDYNYLASKIEQAFTVHVKVRKHRWARKKRGL